MNGNHRKIAMKLAQKTGLKIVTTPFLDSFVKEDETFGDYRMFNVGPDDFVNLIRNAEYILTDSFHGSVFSIINHKKFVTFNRFDDNSKNSRNSRIDNLCNLMGIKNRRYCADADIVKMVTAEIDYIGIDDKLKNLRDKSLHFLKTALDA
jgi:exopolysaccharide biosynthesis predicted pyruvyltransferase EpsI